MKTFALCGNPNCGKTTLFNALTGASAHVGNWPGVTVEKREGVYKKGSEPIAVVDLPGIYSLSPYTPEEEIARRYLLEGAPFGVINIVDADNLERNLYVTTQLLETDLPMIVALNRIDEVEKAGDKIDVRALEERLGVPVVAISARNGSGVPELMARAAALPAARKGRSVLEERWGQTLAPVADAYARQNVPSPLFHAVKLLERDEIAPANDEAAAIVAQTADNADLEAAIADARYTYIAERLAAVKTKARREKLTRSDKIDKVLTHRVWALPLFAVILFAIFHVTFSEDFLYIGAWASLGGGLPSLDELGLSARMETFVGIFYDGAVFSPGVILFNAFDTLFGLITDAVGGAISVGWLSSLTADGVLGGLFAVLGFLPQILLLFMWFSLLEDSGYMARIAFVLDKIFRRFGLSGRAFLPMIMGFGCAVPAMINTRTLADDKERTATVRVIPFFSCGAKLPILTAVAGGVVQHFGVGNAEAITFCMYLLGMAAAVVSVLLMRNTTLKGETPPFIMELPAYHWPRFRNLMLHLWDKAKHFVKKAFTVIFVSTVLIWLFTHLDWSWRYVGENGMDRSILASLGQLVQPLFTPLGFGSQLGAYGWVFAVAAVVGLIAKENVIATFGTLGACLLALGAYVGGVSADVLLTDQEGVAATVAMISATGITVPALIAFIAFNMTTVPCFAAVAAAKGELKKGTFRYTLLFWSASGYVVAAMVYTVGSWWWTAFIWAAVAAAVILCIVLRAKSKRKLLAGHTTGGEANA